MLNYELIKSNIRILNPLNPFKPDNPNRYCCLEDTTNYKYYYDFWIKKNEKIRQLLLESYQLTNDFNLFFIIRLLLNILVGYKIFYICNFPTILKSLPNPIQNEIIKSKFETYCYTGITRGTPHMFYEEEDKKVCVKCGKSLSEIKRLNPDREEFDNLINKIERTNTIKYTNY